MTPKPTEQEAADQREYDSRLAEKQAQVSAMIHGTPQEVSTGLHAAFAANEKPTRRPAVKGVCVNCGKNWSRHFDGFCYAHHAPDSPRFSLERKADPPAPVQQGALTLEQAKHIRALQVKLVDAYEQHRISSENLDGVSEEIDLYLQSLTAS